MRPLIYDGYILAVDSKVERDKLYGKSSHADL
jgi:hypothetical protein